MGRSDRTDFKHSTAAQQPDGAGLASGQHQCPDDPSRWRPTNVVPEPSDREWTDFIRACGRQQQTGAASSR